MQIRRILLRNLHSIRSETEIDFMASPLADTGLFAITGDTGAGKTTILDAITLAMYGKVCRNSKPEETLSHGAEEALAECDFEAGKRKIRCQWRCWVPRSKKGSGPKTERSVAEWDEEKQDYLIVAERKIKEVDAFVEEVSGLDFERFTRSAMLAQGDFAAFLKAAPRERSELLERITGTEVYSELSKAALERTKLEKSKLEAWEAKRDALKVFSQEEVKERKTALKEKKVAAAESKVALDTAKNAWLWLQEVAQLRQRNDAATTALEAVEAEKLALKPVEKQLEQHRKTLPLHPTLARWDDKLAEATSLELAVGELAETQVVEQEAVNAAKTIFEDKNANLKALKAAQPVSMRLFDEVVQMDGRLESLLGKLAASKGEKAASDERNQAAAAQIKMLQGKTIEHEAAIAELSNWLKTNGVLSELPQDLPAVAIHREQLRDILRSQNRVQEEIKQLLQLAEQARQKRAEVTALLAKEQAKLETLLSDFEKTAPESFATSRQDLLEKMTIEIDLLGEQHKNFSQLNALNTDYRAALIELAHLDKRLSELRQTELWLDKSLLTAYEEAEERKLTLAYRREIYNQQLLLSNYEKDRANLREGDPCPLCLSTHHPFRLHDVRPFVDEARAELQAAETTRHQLQQHQNSLLKQHIEVNSQIQQIETAESGEKAKLEARMVALEKRLAALLPGLDGDDYSRSHGDWLVRKVVGFESELTTKKIVREQLAKLNSQIASQEVLVRGLENQLRELRFDEQQNENNRSDRAQSLAALAKKFAEATLDLNKLVGKYGHQFSMDSASQMFEDLEMRGNAFSTNQNKLKENEQALKLAQQALEQQLAVQVELAEKCKALETQVAQVQLDFDSLSAKRQDIFEAKDPVAEREALLETLENEEKSLGEARSTFEQAKERLARVLLQLENNHALLKTSRKVATDLQADLQASLKKAGFDSIDDLRSAVMPIAEAEWAAAQVEQMKQQEMATRQAANSAAEALAVALAQQKTTESEQNLALEISGLEAAVQALQQQIGALNQQLQDNELRKQEGEVILQQIENQRVVFNRWAAVHDLIGSHDGAKFRKFAQGLTLQKLVQLANVHLENLYGRYFVMKRPGEDLELDIVDTFQADNVRSMMTLSGGESFLVSLALALGLSDLAGRNANIRSLFIDEGFGTLDDQTLDLAISTLENLQSKGKTIGVISHVKELKERIATQVRVLKKGGGTSVVEVV